MAKYNKVEEPVFVNSVELRNSKYGNEIYEVDFVGVKTQTEYKSYIDPNNNNFRDWEMILEVAQRKGVVLSKLKFKDEEKGIINADSVPTTEFIIPREELVETLSDYWTSQNNFNKLFGA
jgi:hypothetical protein